MTQLISLAYQVRDLLHLQGRKNIGVMVGSNVVGLIVKYSEESYQTITFIPEFLDYTPEKLTKLVIDSLDQMN